MTSPMSPAERAAAMARCEAATEGPWVPSGLVLNGINLVGHVATVAAKFGSQEATLLFVPMGSRDVEYRGAIADKEFVAHARTDLPRALAELDKADARIASLSAENTGLKRKLAEAISAAEDFSTVIHDIEADGYELHAREDRAWARATQRLENLRASIAKSEGKP